MHTANLFQTCNLCSENETNGNNKLFIIMIACIEFCCRCHCHWHRQQYINKRIIISKGIISTLCIEALVQSRIFIYFCYEQNIEFVFARFPCTHNQINLFMAEISQFNLHFNAFAHYFAGTKTVYMAFVSTLRISRIFTDLCSFFVYKCVREYYVSNRALLRSSSLAWV